MIQQTFSRRAMVIGATAVLALSPLAARALGQAPALRVFKDPDCGCCTAWIEIVSAAGFSVTARDMANADLARYKSDRGIPPEMVSCHTGEIDGYMIEGHVPPADILGLLAERPDAIGLAVPAMPYGAPGMGPETEREPYDIFLIRRDGRTEIFNRYGAA